MAPLAPYQSFIVIKERRKKLRDRLLESKKNLRRYVVISYFLEYLPINCACAMICPSIAFKSPGLVIPAERFNIVSNA